GEIAGRWRVAEGERSEGRDFGCCREDVHAVIPDRLCVEPGQRAGGHTFHIESAWHCRYVGGHIVDPGCGQRARRRPDYHWIVERAVCGQPDHVHHAPCRLHENEARQHVLDRPAHAGDVFATAPVLDRVIRSIGRGRDDDLVTASGRLRGSDHPLE